MSKITKTQLVRLQKKLHTDARIGEEFGITRQAVHQLRKKFDIPSRTANNPMRNNEMVAMRDSGKTVEVIARKFKLSIPQTYRILKDNSKKKIKKVKKTTKKSAKKSPAKKTAAKKTESKKSDEQRSAGRHLVIER